MKFTGLSSVVSGLVITNRENRSSMPEISCQRVRVCTVVGLKSATFYDLQFLVLRIFVCALCVGPPRSVGLSAAVANDITLEMPTAVANKSASRELAVMPLGVSGGRLGNVPGGARKEEEGEAGVVVPVTLGSCLFEREARLGFSSLFSLLSCLWYYRCRNNLIAIATDVCICPVE